jgi:hypothetical protein
LIIFLSVGQDEELLKNKKAISYKYSYLSMIKVLVENVDI